MRIFYINWGFSKMPAKVYLHKSYGRNNWLLTCGPYELPHCNWNWRYDYNKCPHRHVTAKIRSRKAGQPYFILANYPEKSHLLWAEIMRRYQLKKSGQKRKQNK